MKPAVSTWCNERHATVGFRCALILCFSFLLSCFPRAAQAQLADYDKGQLIEALAAENMTELLERLIETDPPDDPVETAQVTIARHRLRYADLSLPVEQRTAAFESALQATRDMIAAHGDHELRPLWQTDLAAMLVDEYLGVIHNAADLFHEFGVPTAAQRDAVTRTAPEAYALAADANLRFFTLRGDLPRQPDHVARRVNTGLWERMIDEYYLKRTQLYLARAAHLVALLPESDRPKPADALLAEALNALDNTGSKLRDDPAIADAVAALAGRIRLQRGDFAGAEADLAKAANAQGVMGLMARLAQVQLTARRADAAAALAQLRPLHELPIVRENLVYRLLVTDLAHRLQPPGSAASFEPYAQLFEDRTLGDRAEGLRQYVYQRWADGVEAGREDALPPMVRMAVAQTLRERGQLALQAGDAAAAADPLDRSIRINRALLDGDAPDPVKAGASYNLGLATYLRGGDLPAVLDAARLLTDTAEQHPTLPVGERAINDAVALLRSMHATDPRPAGVDAAYRRAAEVLFAQYPTSAAADNERVYYAYSVLQADEDYRKAVEFYRRVPADHPTYHDAQREMLFALEALGAESELNEAIDRVLRAERGGDGEPARRAAAAARIVQAQSAYTSGRLDEALAILDTVQQQYAAFGDLLRLALERRILMLAEASRAAPLAKAAGDMMRTFPDDAAAVIDGVLTGLDERIERHRAVADNPTAPAAQRTAATQRIDELAKTATGLAELLAEWARGQGFDDAEMAAYELIRVKVLLLAGDAPRAVELVEQQLAKFPDDLGVLHAAGEAYYHAGDEASLIRAAQTFDRIIQGLPPPYPPEYWHAWMRRLQINDALGKFTDQIAPTVRRLELQDAQLGGPPYSQELRRLERKYAAGGS